MTLWVLIEKQIFIIGSERPLSSGSEPTLIKETLNMTSDKQLTSCNPTLRQLVPKPIWWRASQHRLFG